MKKVVYVLTFAMVSLLMNVDSVSAQDGNKGAQKTEQTCKKSKKCKKEACCKEKGQKSCCKQDTTAAKSGAPKCCSKKK